MTAQLQSPDDSDAPSPSIDVQVQPQIYLKIPDYVNRSGKMIRITKENITTCMSLFGSSIMFDSGALFSASPTTEDKGTSIIF